MGWYDALAGSFRIMCRKQRLRRWCVLVDTEAEASEREREGGREVKMKWKWMLDLGRKHWRTHGQTIAQNLQWGPVPWLIPNWLTSRSSHRLCQIVRPRRHALDSTPTSSSPWAPPTNYIIRYEDDGSNYKRMPLTSSSVPPANIRRYHWAVA